MSAGAWAEARPAAGAEAGPEGAAECGSGGRRPGRAAGGRGRVSDMLAAWAACRVSIRGARSLAGVGPVERLSEGFGLTRG
ncbi:hypothetical protein GCM10010393_39640 [Streptomyces gobitricini]|uniref:Uncharacterized protein n=1 Tax=Streptomyces gobitricini TaxID=68211 RepID=A0ABN3ML87_9ACTN